MNLSKYLIMFFCSIIIFIIGIHLTNSKKVLNQAFGMLISAISDVFGLISVIGIVMIFMKI